MIAYSRSGNAMFFYEMLSRWLVPMRQLHISSYFASDTMLDKKNVTVATMNVHAASDQELRSIEMMLPILLEEVKLGLLSSYHAKRILEIKGLSISDKMGFVFDHLRKVIKRFPEHYDYDLIPLMQRFFIHTSDEFRGNRSVRVLEQRVLSIYCSLQKMQHSKGEDRKVNLRIRKDTVMQLFGEKQVLSITLSVSFLKETERFTQKHLERAIAECIPDAHVVPESYYVEINPEERSRVYTIELEFEEAPPPRSDILLYKSLPRAVAMHIEQLTKPLVMPRNDEEVMKHMILLAGQLSSPKDIPQMILSFSEQTESALTFTVILARVLKDGVIKMPNLIESRQDIRLEKMRERGMVWKKYPKELSVLRVTVPLSRDDKESKRVHFMRARNAAQKNIESLVGPVRDYYGGIYEKERRQLEQLCEELKKDGVSFSDVELFYQGIFPTEYRSVFPSRLLARLYRLYIRLREEKVDSVSENDEGGELFMKRFYDQKQSQEVLQKIKKEGGYRVFFLREEYGQVFLGGVNFVRNTFGK